MIVGKKKRRKKQPHTTHKARYKQKEKKKKRGGLRGEGVKAKKKKGHNSHNTQTHVAAKERGGSLLQKGSQRKEKEGKEGKEKGHHPFCLVLVSMVRQKEGPKKKIYDGSNRRWRKREKEGSKGDHEHIHTHSHITISSDCFFLRQVSSVSNVL